MQAYFNVHLTMLTSIVREIKGEGSGPSENTNDGAHSNASAKSLVNKKRTTPLQLEVRPCSKTDKVAWA